MIPRGRITAKRLLPAARAAGYKGSSRNFRRAAAQEKEAWKRKRRSYKPWLPVAGQHLVIDWGDAPAGLHVFCAAAMGLSVVAGRVPTTAMRPLDAGRHRAHQGRHLPGACRERLPALPARAPPPHQERGQGHQSTPQDAQAREQEDIEQSTA